MSDLFTTTTTSSSEENLWHKCPGLPWWERLDEPRLFYKHKGGEPVQVPEQVEDQVLYLYGTLHRKTGYKDPALSLSEDYLLGRKGE